MTNNKLLAEALQDQNKRLESHIKELMLNGTIRRRRLEAERDRLDDEMSRVDEAIDKLNEAYEGGKIIETSDVSQFAGVLCYNSTTNFDAQDAVARNTKRDTKL